MTLDWLLVQVAGFEPTVSGTQIQCLTKLGNTQKYKEIYCVVSRLLLSTTAFPCYQDTIESTITNNISKQIAVSAFYYYLSEAVKTAPFNNSICSKGQFLFSQSG